MPPTTDPTALQEHGWTPVPRSLSTLLSTRSNPQPSPPIPLSTLQPPPSTPLVDMVRTYARTNLSRQTFAHSMRVYYFSLAILQSHFPSWSSTLSRETLLLTSLLHDIATTPAAMDATFMSFEFSGGFTALKLLEALASPRVQRESVAETIIRHQDLGETGMVSRLTATVHFATVLDNAGLYADLVHRETVKEVVAAWPREGWTGCFAGVVGKEVEGKPWSNTTRIEGFADMVEANEAMREWD